jgi:hypothetical protein
MTRALYRCLVWLHPPIFRREFAGEMLWIYDEASQSTGAAPLLLDGIVSLARQWILRSAWWKPILTLAGALFQVSICGALMMRLAKPRPHERLPIAEHSELMGLIRLATFTAVGLLAAVILLVFWWRKLLRRQGV